MSKYKSRVSPYEEIYEHVGNFNELIFHSLGGITNPDPSYEVTRPNADCFSIEYIIEGEGTIQEDDKIFNVKQGDFFILHPWKTHHYYSSKKNPWKKIWLYVTNAGHHVATLLNIQKIEHQVVFSDVNSPLNLESIFELHKESPPDFRRKIELMLYELIMDLSHFSKSNHTQKTSVQLAKWYINQNIDKKITVMDVSKYVGLDNAYFSKIFKKEYNITPVQYILKKKMAMAMHLLATTTRSVSEISEHLNFSDVSHFSRTFQKHCHRTPLEYRAHALNNMKLQQNSNSVDI